ncbi:MAG: energy transducer TonB [Bacteroidia bacterium]|nr:energy transducer TonB [Bacteroidia bacterium]
MFRFIALFLLTLPLAAFSQRLPEKDPKNEHVFVYTEKMPVFPGGEEALYDYIKTHLRYPDSLAGKNIQGKVYLTFIVSEKGKISDVEVLRGVQRDLDQEAVRMIQSMPDWIPGEQSGVPVKVRFSLPVYFKLN